MSQTELNVRNFFSISDMKNILEVYIIFTHKFSLSWFFLHILFIGFRKLLKNILSTLLLVKLRSTFSCGAHGLRVFCECFYISLECFISLADCQSFQDSYNTLNFVKLFKLHDFVIFRQFSDSLYFVYYFFNYWYFLYINYFIYLVRSHNSCKHSFS